MAVTEKANFLAQHGTITVTIADELERVRAGEKWINGDRHVESIVKTAGLNVALVMLKSGTRLDEHRTKAPITVQVIEGRLAFFAKGVRHELAPGSILALERDVPHAVEALGDAAFILTVGGE